MDYDYKKTQQHPMYRTSSSSPMYPRVGSQYGHVAVPPATRPSPYHHAAAPPPSASSSVIRVVMKPEYRLTPPPHLSPLLGEIPMSNFQFEFDFEKKVLAEAKKENQNWGSIAADYLPSRTPDPIHFPTPTPNHGGNPIVSKYIALGLSREAVPLAVTAYGDDPTMVREFVNGYTLLREMGFSSSAVADALVLYENDTDKALARLLNSN